MALIVEDGTLVPDANSFCTLAELRTFAIDRGITLSDDDDVLTTHAILATDYLRPLNYQGVQVTSDQALPWPRDQVWLNGALFPNNEIPINLKNAQSQLCIEQKNGVAIFPTVASNRRVTRERVGPVEAQYEYLGSSTVLAMDQVNNWLDPLLSPTGARLRTVRV